MKRRVWIILGLAAAIALPSRPSLAGPPKPEPKKPAEQPKDEQGKDKGDQPKDKKAAAKDPAAPGKPAPDFTLKDCYGKTYQMADYKDKVVVLAWYHNECPYIKRYGPTLQEMYDKYTKKGVIWLSVDSTGANNDKINIEHLKKTKRTFPILSDFDGKVGHAYKAQNTPHMFVINKGTVAYNGALLEQGGDHKWVEEAVDALLAGKTVAKTKTKPFG